MPDVPATFCHINGRPILTNPLQKLIFSSWLHLMSYEFFKLMPNIFYWVHIRQFWWCSEPINSFFYIKSLSHLGDMLGIIVLNKAVCGRKRKFFFNKWYKCSLKYFTIEDSIHSSIKDANTSSTFFANSGPYVDFYWVFRTRF